MNPNHLKESLGLDLAFLRKWKAPAFLVWPTIATGFFILFEVSVVSDIAFNIFQFLMAIYIIQGLSVLSYLFDLWGIQVSSRLMRFFLSLFLFFLSLFLMLPLVLSLGFFDLWFDFRGKFRQS
jgi:hypothetical protein